MPKKLIICAHGIGDHKEGFQKSWAEILHDNHKADTFKVEGLFWDDLQDQLYDKFMDITPATRDVVEQTFLKSAFQYLDDPAHEGILNFLKEYAFDALSYLFFKEFRDAILWPKCIIRLNEIITKYKNYQPVLIGHSLGSILLTHITWFIRNTTGNLNYYDFFLLGSPIGLRSPLDIIPDFNMILADIGHHPSRMDALNIWAQEWWSHRRKRLHIIINELDLIAWDVKVDVGVGEDIDIIPLRQGLSPKEINKIENANPATIEKFRSGSKKVQDIINNHDVASYLNSDPFKKAFDKIL